MMLNYVTLIGPVWFKVIDIAQRWIDQLSTLHILSGDLNLSELAWKFDGNIKILSLLHDFHLTKISYVKKTKFSLAS